MARIVGASPLILVLRSNGLSEYVWPGRPAPDDADEKQLALLLEEGHLVDLDGPPPAPAVELDDLDRPVAPPRNAPREAWETYLHVVGYTAEDTDGYGRDELRDFTLPPE